MFERNGTLQSFDDVDLPFLRPAEPETYGRDHVVKVTWSWSRGENDVMMVKWARSRVQGDVVKVT